MKKIGILAFVFLLGFTNYAQNKKWTLQECVTHALENNISIKQSELDVEFADINRRDAFGNLLPNVNASATNSWNTGLTQNITTGILQTQTTRNFSAGVTASVNLFDGLRNYKELQRAKLSQLGSQYALDKMKDDITLFIADSYLQVLLNKQTLEVLTSQNEVTKEQLVRTSELVDAGSLPRGDLLEIEATDADEKQRIIVANNNIRISLIRLAQILLIKDYENFEISDEDYNIFGMEILDKSVYEIIEKAKEERSELRIAELNRNLAEKDLEISRGAYYPSLVGFFNYNTRESGQGRILGANIDPNEPTRPIGVVESTGEIVVAPNFITALGDPLPFFDQLSRNDGISYGLQISVPIFNGLAARNQVRRNQVNVRRASFELEQAELDLEANVYQAYIDAQGAFEAYEAALISNNAQDLAYEYASERYDVGLTNAFEFSQSKLRYENSQREVLRTKYDYIFKLKVLELYFGIPVTNLKF